MAIKGFAELAHLGMRMNCGNLLTCALIALGVAGHARGEGSPSREPFPAGMVDVSYVTPTNPAHVPIYDRMRERKVLEQFRDFLSPLKLTRRLIVTMRNCGRVNAFYSRASTTVTICYEFIQQIRERAPASTTPEGVTYEDAVIAGVVSVLLHETSHAVFDIFHIPILGREEDAADQLAGFIMVHSARMWPAD